MYVVFLEQIFERKTLGGGGGTVFHRNQGKVVLDKTSPLAIALNGQAFWKVGPRRNHNSQQPQMSLFHSKNDKKKGTDANATKYEIYYILYYITYQIVTAQVKSKFYILYYIALYPGLRLWMVQKVSH